MMLLLKAGYGNTGFPPGGKLRKPEFGFKHSDLVQTASL